jgi:hypothetical protein
VATAGTVSVKVNNRIGSYIKSFKGLVKVIRYHQFFLISWLIV